METFGDKIRRIAAAGIAELEKPGAAERVAELAKESAVEAARRAEKDRMLYLATSGIPARFVDLLDNPKPTPAMDAVRACLAEGGPTCITLAGKAGNGKTSALCWGVYRGVGEGDKQRRGTFIRAIDLVQASQFDPNFWADLRSAPVLAIDELGAEPQNHAALAMVFDLLNRRIENMRPTLIATNLDGPEFSRKYLSGPMERLKDRLTNYGRWVEFTAPSMRSHWAEVGES